MEKTLIIPIRIAAEVVAIHITDDPEIADELYNGDSVGIGSFRFPAGDGDDAEFHVIAELTPYGAPRLKLLPPPPPAA